MSWSPEPAPTGDWAADRMVGETGRAGHSGLQSTSLARAADDLGHPDPLDSEGGVGEPGNRSLLIGRLLDGGVRMLRG